MMFDDLSKDEKVFKKRLIEKWKDLRKQRESFPEIGGKKIGIKLHLNFLALVIRGRTRINLDMDLKTFLQTQNIDINFHQEVLDSGPLAQT